ncbi:hypothetical protein [Arthrobacter sp. STN4]|uniref:AAA family ATPase n=1 Tax=Arthrobacter sp. STN4 TaxID=2923276 RepID=UPI002119F0C7|nr:hypothetical protein [Arthrobacter sp. STN4]MCQ9163042.1 hypothetical protein [Arthrobacter sp. STN4]
MSPVTVVTVGDTAGNPIDALEHRRGPVSVVRRCPELAGLLAACQSGLAQVAVVASETDGLTATLVDRLTAVGVSVVSVADSPAEASRLRSIGAWPVTGRVTAEQITESILAVVSARRHPQSVSLGFALSAPRESCPRPDGLHPDPSRNDAGRTPPDESPPAAGGLGRSGAAVRGRKSARRQKSGAPAPIDGVAPGLPGSPVPGGPGGPADANIGVESGSGQAPFHGMLPDAAEGGASGGGSGGPQGDGAGRGPHGVRANRGLDDGVRPVGRPARDAGGLRQVTARMASGVAGSTLFRNRDGRSRVGPGAARIPGGPADGPDHGGGPPRTLAVWGPIGSPGRTLVAINMAAELAEQGRRVMLIDADSYGASVAASLGLLDEAASFAQACRVADQGPLTVGELARISTEVVCAGGTFSLLTGLTRSDRWPELRAAAVERVLQAALSLVDTVVVDCGFCLETDEELSYDTVAPRRNAATLAVLGQADTVFAVGSADAVGVPRLVRALAALPEACAGAEVQVVLNKVRKRSAGGSPLKELEDAWARFGPALAISHALPWDAELPARALTEGRLLMEIAPESPLRRAILGICCAPAQQTPETAVVSATAGPGNPG